MNTLPLQQQWVITFRWNYDGKSINKQISKQEAARDNLNNAIIRIGREKPSCNLYLEDSSVSGQHAEIYFHEQQQKFFIKSLQPRNITKIDGQDLVYGEELPLNNNSSIILGQQKIEVTNIKVFDLPATNYSGIVNSSPNSNPVNPNPNSIPVNLNLNLSNTDQKPNLNQSKHWWQEPTMQVAIIGALVGIITTGVTWYSNKETQKTEMFKSELQASSTEKLDYIKRLQDHKQKVIDLLEKDKDNNQIYSRLRLTSDCDQPINVAVSYLAPNDIEQTKGWFTVTNQRPISPSFYTLKPFINLHGYIQDNRYKNLYNELKRSQSYSKAWKPEVINKYLEENNYRNKQWKGSDGLVERNIIFPSDFDYIENPLFLNRDEKDIIDKVEFHAFKFKYKPSGSQYTEAKFSCRGDNLTLEIQN